MRASGSNIAFGNDPLPYHLTVKVAAGDAFVRTLSGNDPNIITVPLHQKVSCAPDVGFLSHDKRRTAASILLLSRARNERARERPKSLAPRSARR